MVSTPAKIILSGEHSVCYGAPAIGAPVALYLHSSFEWGQAKPLSLNAAGQKMVLAQSKDDLLQKLALLRRRYQSFQQGEGTIEGVLRSPFDLVTLTLGVYAEKYNRNMEGLSLSLETEIPLSSGMGSSSALIVNLLESLAGRFEPEMLDLARGIEDFQHGASSGLDLAIVSSRRPLVYAKEKGIIGTVTPAFEEIVLVNTGKPAVSTGQCVAFVRDTFANDNALWADFSACTQAIQTALEGGRTVDLQAGIAENQQLLSRIGVVPEKTASFIEDCGKAGIAAKVCGAGAVRGDSAGMLWALAGDDDALARLSTISGKYGYSHGRYSFAR